MLKKIARLVRGIDEELKGAKNYAESYVEYKAKQNSTWANRYKEMSNDELKHANYLHDLAIIEIEELSKVFKAPQEMQDEWDKSHISYVENVAWIKQMLSM